MFSTARNVALLRPPRVQDTIFYEASCMFAPGHAT